jgi:CRP-like cAMP-binding protein
MKKSAIIRTVSGTPLFSDLTQREISLTVSKSKTLNVMANQELTFKNCITLILKGSVAVTKPNGDKKPLMRFLGCGGVSGVATLFSDDHTAVSTLVTLKPTEVLVIDHDTVAELIASNGAFAMKYISFLTSRIRFLNSRIDAFTAGNAETKLALHLLLSDESESGEIDLHVSLCSLADMLDISRASLYRAFDCLESKGIIIKNGKKIKVLDKEALKQASVG